MMRNAGIEIQSLGDIITFVFCSCDPNHPATGNSSQLSGDLPQPHLKRQRRPLSHRGAEGIRNAANRWD